MTDSRRHHESMTALGNIPILLHSMEFVHLHGMGLFERTYTHLGINLLHRRHLLVYPESPKYSPSHVPLSIPPRIDCLLRSQSVTSRCHGVAPSVYRLHILDSLSEGKNRSHIPLNLHHRCCRAALVIVEAVQKLSKPSPVTADVDTYQNCLQQHKPTATPKDLQESWGSQLEIWKGLPSTCKFLAHGMAVLRLGNCFLGWVYCICVFNTSENTRSRRVRGPGVHSKVVEVEEGRGGGCGQRRRVTWHGTWARLRSKVMRDAANRHPRENHAWLEKKLGGHTHNSRRISGDYTLYYDK